MRDKRLSFSALIATFFEVRPQQDLSGFNPDNYIDLQVYSQKMINFAKK